MRKWVTILWIILSVTTILFLLVSIGYIANKAVNVYTGSVLKETGKTIIIDAGHGGVDGGAVSCTGVYESQLNLEIALRLNDLMQLLGFHTKMIRTEDISVYIKGDSIAQKKISDLKERVRLINSTENAVLISIHQNYFQDSQYSGAQVFYASGSEELAKQLQSQFAASINLGSKRKSKKASGIYLMEHINCPGVLIECGFLSNPAEENALRDPCYQKKICSVIASTVSRCLNDAVA